MKLGKITAVVAVAATLFFSSCKPKDGDVQKSLQAKEAAGITVEVKDGVATLSGTVTDDAAKAAAGKISDDEKGVKSTVNNITVAVPVVATPTVPASVTTVLDAATQQKVKDGLKDIKGVTVEFTADRAVLKGEVSSANRIKIMQMLASAHVKYDTTSTLTTKP